MFQKGDLVQFDLSKLPVIAGKTYKVINELRNPKHGIIRDVAFRQLGNSTTSFTGAYVDTFPIDLSRVLFTVTANSSLFKAHRGNMSQILVIEPVDLGHNSFIFALRVDLQYLQAYKALEIEIEI